MKKVKKISKVCMLLVCIISLVCIPFATSAAAGNYEPSKAAKINFFNASKTAVKSGESITLSWGTQNATKVDIKGIEKNQENEFKVNDTIEVWPEVTTTYILTAYGNGGDDSRTITVNVGTAAKVKVEYFNASSTSVKPGDTVKLTWKTSNAKTVVVKGYEKEQECTGQEELEVWPEKTTTYVIYAYGPNDDVDSKSVTVNVIDNPVVKDVEIKYFNASASEINPGQNVNLSWDVSNAKSISIKDVKNYLPAQGTLNVTPYNTTTYTLVAIGQNDKAVTKTVTVTVKQAQNNPIINYFNASNTTVSKGTMVTLSWDTKNTTGCMILTSDGKKLDNKPSTGKVSVTPNTTRTYTLVAFNARNEKVQKEITITVK